MINATHPEQGFTVYCPLLSLSFTDTFKKENLQEKLLPVIGFGEKKAFNKILVINLAGRNLNLFAVTVLGFH